MSRNQGPIVDVVGAVEATKILQVELQRISRWRKKGRLPPPYAALVCSPVWVRADIYAVKHKDENYQFTRPPRKLPLLGTREVADLLGLDKSQVSRWQGKPPKTGPRFPTPVARIAAGPLWDAKQIRRFARARARTREAVHG